MWRYEDPSWLMLLWLLPLLPLLIGAGRASLTFRRRLVCLVVRALIIAALVLALARPSIEQKKSWSPDPVVLPLLDRSASVGLNESTLLKKVREYENAVPAGVLAEGGVFAGRCGLNSSMDDVDSSQTDLEAALDWAAQRLGDNPNGHVLLFTDGRATRGRALSAAARAAANRLHVHAIPIGEKRETPPRIVGVTPPDDARAGTTAYALIHVRSDEPRQLRLAVLNDEGVEVARRSIRVEGDVMAGVPITPRRKGLHAWSVTLADERQSGVNFDLAELDFDVSGPPSILLCDPQPLSLDPLQKVLRRLRFDHIVATPAEFPTERAALDAYDLIMLSDWAEPSLTASQITLLDEFVRRGGGLIFIGGSNVGTREWHDSPLEALLPIDFAPSRVKEKQKLKPVHVCFVLDSSGSMGQVLGADSSGPVTKFAMTKAAVAASLNVLPESALVTLIVFDAQFNVVLEAMSIAEREEILTRLERLGVGGGTNIVPPMIEALQILNRTDMPKHMIVLTDGISSENPPDELLDWVRSSKISLTAVAVGADSNVELMQRIAKHTQGIYHFCGDATRIPQVFVREAEHITTLAKLDQPPLQPRSGPQPELIAGLAADGWPMLEAAVPAKAKFAPTVAVSLTDDKDRPLLARWTRGLGSIVAFLSDAKPLWARRWMEWPDFERFWARVITSSLPTSSPLGAVTDVRVEDEQCMVLLSVYDEEGSLPTDARPRGYLNLEQTHLQGGSQDSEMSLRWRRVSEAVFEGRATVLPGKRYVGQIEVGSAAGESLLRRRFLVSGGRETELLETGPDERALRALAAAGNGVFDPTPARLTALVEERHAEELTHVWSYWPWLVTLAILLWPIDVALRRFGVRAD